MKDRILDYLDSNLRDPGTMRSLIWALMGIAMNARAEAPMEHYATLAMIAFGLVSAAIPPRKP